MEVLAGRARTGAAQPDFSGSSPAVRQAASTTAREQDAVRCFMPAMMFAVPAGI
ncbi:hypothetical protein [Microbispora rosea]|uniref:hypothetical protein n=1 Tax=Microbispora rosea TaxID=58117 RepID=UPI003D93E545